MMLSWNMIICNSPESKSNIIDSSVICVYSESIHHIYSNSERIQILHTCYFSISLRAAGIDGRLRIASISLVREQPPHDQVLQVGIVQTVYGPILPPEMLWTNLFSNMMPHILSLKVPLSLSTISFGWVKRSW
jgi:hypothetical protein